MNTALRPIVIAVVRDNAGRFLLIERAINEGALSWAFAGGKAEAGESAAATAVREVREETGIICAAVRVLGSRIHPQTQLPVTYVLCSAPCGQQFSLSSREVKSAGFFKADDVYARITSNIYPAVRALLDAPFTPATPTSGPVR